MAQSVEVLAAASRGGYRRAVAILPVALLLGLGLLAAIAWSAAGLLGARRQGGLPRARVAVFLASSFACWLGVSLFLYVAGGLSHSSHAVRDALPWYAATFAVFLAAPVALVAFLARRGPQGRVGGPGTAGADRAP